MSEIIARLVEICIVKLSLNRGTTIYIITRHKTHTPANGNYLRCRGAGEETTQSAHAQVSTHVVYARLLFIPGNFPIFPKTHSSNKKRSPPRLARLVVTNKQDLLPTLRLPEGPRWFRRTTYISRSVLLCQKGSLSIVRRCKPTLCACLSRWYADKRPYNSHRITSN